MPVRPGFESLIASGRLDGLRIGLVCNPASVDGALRHVVDRLADAGVAPSALFGPQHGMQASAQDNMIETPHARDDRRGVPVYSLYGETREPTAAMLSGLDLLLIDLQDVGTRVYTFAYTMANCLRACRRHGIPAVVCDRPNPIGGTRVDGPVLEEAFRSFVGQFPIPLRHGLTIGELARLFNETFGLGADLEIARMDGWTRDLYHDQTALPWIMPSPNLPTLDSAIVYPGMVLLEGTTASEGRGTTRPFELAGAPWVDAERFAERLNAAGLPGVHFRPVVFEPTFQKHAGRRCGGCQVHVLDRGTFRPVLTAVTVLQELRRVGGRELGWRPPPYEYEHEKMPIDILAGSDALRRGIDAGASAFDIAADWEDSAEAFLRLRSDVLLY